MSSPRVDDVEKMYRNSLSKTQLRSDRGDLGMYSFAGSHLHGGAPAAEKVLAPKVKGSTTRDLYAPLGERPYGTGYYDHLRATSPEPRRRTKRKPVLDEPDYSLPSRPDFDADFKDLSSKISTDMDRDFRRAPTERENWVPLTTHIYNIPHDTYYYRTGPTGTYSYRTLDDSYGYKHEDDYKIGTTTSKTTRNVDVSDSRMSSKYEYSSYR